MYLKKLNQESQPEILAFNRLCFSPADCWSEEDWTELLADERALYYALLENGRIVGNILFHSVPYTQTSKDALEFEEYNKLGTAASMGCIRLSVEDAKWIYDHVKEGMQVWIHDGAAADPELRYAIRTHRWSLFRVVY